MNIIWRRKYDTIRIVIPIEIRFPFFPPATNHQWTYLLKLDTPQDMLIDWSLTLNGISFSVMWGSIFSIYQLPVSLLFKIGYTRIGRWKKGDRYQTLFVVLWSLHYLSIDHFGFSFIWYHCWIQINMIIIVINQISLYLWIWFSSIINILCVQ
jgi:hypothetical protein